MGQLVSLFLAVHGDKDERIQNYELTHSFHNDESFRYFVFYSPKNGQWKIGEE